MTSRNGAIHRPAAERLVAALVDWGASASQIVSHMELHQDARASRGSRSTVEVFRGLLLEVVAPVLPTAEAELEQTAELLERLNERVIREIVFVGPAMN